MRVLTIYPGKNYRDGYEEGFSKANELACRWAKRDHAKMVWSAAISLLTIMAVDLLAYRHGLRVGVERERSSQELRAKLASGELRRCAVGEDLTFE